MKYKTKNSDLGNLKNFIEGYSYSTPPVDNTQQNVPSQTQNESLIDLIVKYWYVFLTIGFLIYSFFIK